MIGRTSSVDLVLWQLGRVVMIDGDVESVEWAKQGWA
jgi:hypothetical protein